MTVVLLTAFMSGCTEKEASNQTAPAAVPQNGDRYVQINLLDGTSIGGKYISETAAFTTINVLYTLNPKAYTYENGTRVKDVDNYVIKGNGAEVSIKNALIDTMITIEKPDPDQMIASIQQEVDSDLAVAAKAQAEKIKTAMEEKAKYEAERAKHMPTG